MHSNFLSKPIGMEAFCLHPRPRCPLREVVTDLCPECKKGDLDFALDGDGRHHVSWEAVPATPAVYELRSSAMGGWWNIVWIEDTATPLWWKTFQQLA